MKLIKHHRIVPLSLVIVVFEILVDVLIELIVNVLLQAS